MVPGINNSEADELYRSINSTFGKLLGVEFGFDELQCLTQQELYSLLQSSENLKKLYQAKILHINAEGDKDKIKDDIDYCLKYLKPVIEKYGTNDELFDTILYVNDLLEEPREKIDITDLPELIDFFSEHIIDKAKFDILKKLSEEGDFTPMNIRYKVIAVENYLNGKNGDIPLEVNYKEIERESVLLECRENGGWINLYGKIIPLYHCGAHDYLAETIIGDDEYLRRKFSKYKGEDYREFLVQECGWVKFTGKKFFLKFAESIRRDMPYFSFPTNPITKRPRVTNEQLDAIIDICGTIPQELH